MTIVRSIMKYVRKQVGKPYKYRAAGPDAFDCSGLVKAAAEQAGLNLYHGATHIYNDGFLDGDPRKYGYWGKHGTIDTLPMLRFAVLFNRDDEDANKMAHTGFAIRGKMYQAGGYGGTGVHKGDIDKKHFTHWCRFRKGLKADLLKAALIPNTIKYGASGELVVTLQNLLNQNGAALDVDGKFGSGTKAAVVAYQTKHKLNADGIVGWNTWNALLSDDADVITLLLSGLTIDQATEVKNLAGQYDNVTVEQQS